MCVVKDRVSGINRLLYFNGTKHIMCSKQNRYKQFTFLLHSKAIKPYVNALWEHSEELYETAPQKVKRWYYSSLEIRSI